VVRLPILVAMVAESAVITLLTLVSAAALGIAVPPMKILVEAKRLAADTLPENSAATPDTLVVKLPFAATRLVALTAVLKLPVAASTSVRLSVGLTTTVALVVAVDTETPPMVSRTVPFP
jgi:hypothetical protein